MTAVEATLGKIGRGNVGTPAWHLDVAQRLIQIATQLNRSGEAAAAAGAAKAALEHARSAGLGATDPLTHSTANSVMGFIEERFLSDLTGALASYRQAAKYSPKANRAVEAAARLSNTVEGRP